MATSTKPWTLNLEVKKESTTGYNRLAGCERVFGNETTSLFCKATDNCCNRYVVSLESGVDGRLPSQFLDQLNCLTGRCQVPAISMAAGVKTLVRIVGCICWSCWWRQAHSMAVLLTWTSAYVSRTVTSQPAAFPSTMAGSWGRRGVCHFAKADRLAL